MINLENYKELLFLDKYEKEFCNTNKLNLNPSGSPIIIQCVNDLFYLKLFSFVIDQEKDFANKIYGVITVTKNIRLIDIALIFPVIFKLLIAFLNKKKLKRMYSSIGVSNFVDSSKLNFYSRIINFFTSIPIFLKIQSKRDLIDFSYSNIKCGDLVYDTVVRFNSKKPTLKLRSFSTFYYLYNSINQIEFFKLFFKNINYSKAFFSQAVYIYHGIPTRVLASYQKGTVYTAGNYTQMFKLISDKHFYMMENFHDYTKIANSIALGKNEIEQGLKKFEKRFEGEDDTGYIFQMKVNPYKEYNKLVKKNHHFDGVLFLHDFYDAHKLYGDVLFNDFYEWTLFTLNLIRDNNLKIAIKPHPYQIPESQKIQKKIQSSYNELIWLDPLISNKRLIDGGIKYGITQHGTIISELAYFKINCIYCAENPVSPYNIGSFANSKEHYKNLILNANNLMVDPKIKEKIGEYYYIHYINKKSDYILNNKSIDGINIKKINRFKMKSKDLLL